MSTSRFLNMAERFGASLVEQAIWTDDVCTWLVNVPDYEQSDGSESYLEEAGGRIYQGTAGIAFFLAQLAQYTDAPTAVADTVQGALRHAVQTIKDDATEHIKQNYGFHTGPIGVAWALMQAAPVCDWDVSGDIGAMIDPLDGNEHLDQGLDVIGGAAGAIPALLELASFLGSDQPARMALRLGERVIHRANKEPLGWSWPMGTSSTARYLTGYAHGASGIGQAFLELYAVTGAPRYRYAAQRAFRYEDQFLDPETGDWPDFRNTERGKLLRNSSVDELADMALRGELPTYSLHSMRAWCHGAPGIALARLRSLSLLPDETDRTPVDHALRATGEDTSLQHSNHSLCHGFSGNAMSLLYATEVLGDDQYRGRAAERAVVELDKWEHTTDWPGGTAGRKPDPSLMLGIAGTGHFFLKLHDASVPHVCVLTAPEDLDIGHLMEEEQIAPEMGPLIEDHVRRFFPTALTLADQAPPVLGDLADSLAAPTTADLHDTPVLDYRERVQLLLQEEHEASGSEDSDHQASRQARDLLESALTVDLERVRAVQNIDDFTTHRDHAYVRIAIGTVDWATAIVQPSPNMVLVEQPHDWTSWLAADPDKRGDQPSSSPTTYVLFDRAPKIGAEQMGTFGTLVLKAIDGPTTRSDIVSALREFIDASVPDPVIEQKVTEQLQRAFEQGIIIPTQDMIDQLAASTGRQKPSESSSPEVHTTNSPHAHPETEA